MPSSSLLYGAINRQPSSTSYQTPPSFRAPSVVIHPMAREALADEMGGIPTPTAASAAYPASSRVLAFPFALDDYVLAQKTFWINGTTASTDSADTGVYDEAGTNLLFHSGSTLIAGASSAQVTDITDVLLAPGRYWCAYVQSGTTATPFSWALGALNLALCGCAQMAGSGSTLGSSFTPARVASTGFNWFGFSGRVVL